MGSGRVWSGLISPCSRSVCSRVRFGAHSVPLTVPVSDGTSPAGRVEWGRQGKETGNRTEPGFTRQRNPSHETPYPFPHLPAPGGSSVFRHRPTGGHFASLGVSLGSLCSPPHAPSSLIPFSSRVSPHLRLGSSLTRRE